MLWSEEIMLAFGRLAVLDQSAHAKGILMISRLFVATFAVALSSSVWAMCPYDYNCLNNPYGAGVHTNRTA
jgi:hypothetical protein